MLNTSPMTAASNDIEFYATQLVDAAKAAVPRWIEQQISQRLPDPIDKQTSQQIQQLAAEASTHIVAELEILVFTDIDQQRTTPLSILRQLVSTVTEVLDKHDTQRPRRDSQKAALYPDDIYDVTPANFAAFGADMHEAGIAWGAAKAYEHLHRRRQEAL